MAETAKAQNQSKAKFLARCGERVVFARLLSGFEGAYMLGGNLLREAGQKIDGKDVTAMALHPAGLAIVPTVGVHAGKRIIVPLVNVAFVAVAEEEG